MELTKQAFTQYLNEKLETAASEEERQFLMWHHTQCFYELRQFCSLMADRPLKSVLDIGPGNFFFADAIRRLYPDVVYEGVEPESSMKGTGFFETTTQEYKYRVHDLDLEKEIAHDSKYDAIVCFDVLEHLLHNPSMFLYNVHTLLSDTGVFMMTTDNVARLINVVKLMLGMNIYFPLESPYYVRHNREYTLKEMTDLLAGTGFNVLRGCRFNFLPVYPSRSQTQVYRLLNLISEIPGFRRHKRHMFFAGEKKQEPQLYRPTWLYKLSYGWKCALER